jgi:hypothetical protein
MRRVTQVGVECHLGGARSCAPATVPSTAEGATAGSNEERRCNAWHLTLTTMCKRGWSRWASMVGCVGVDPPIPAGARGQFGGLQASGKSFVWHSTGAHNVDTFGCRLPHWSCCVDAPWQSMEVLRMKIQFRFSDGRWWRSGVVFSLETLSWRPLHRLGCL